MSEQFSPYQPKELPQFAKTKNEETAQVYLKDLGLTWEELKGKEILDVGAGLARFAQEAQKRDMRVTSVDMHPEWHTETGVVPTNVPYLIADARTRLPYEDESFDLIVSRAAVHSMVDTREDLANVLLEVKRLLKNGGEFRFGPGIIGFYELSEQERERLEDLYTRKQHKGEILNAQEEQELEQLSAKADHQDDKGNQEEALRDLPENERMEKLNNMWLEEIRKTEPNITMHKGNEARAPFSDTYFVMKKLPNETTNELLDSSPYPRR